jgi:putative heme-binding domain-containing protein
MNRVPQVLLILACVAIHSNPTLAADDDKSPDSKKPITLKDLRHFAMIKPGKVDHGRELFLSKKLACVTCHSHDQSNSKLGPDLANIGDRMGRGDLIDSILQPSAIIADGYEAISVTTKDGKSHLGILKNATDQSVELRVVGAKPVHIATQEIQSRKTLDVSLMPLGMHLVLSPQDLTDLADYLVSLKGPDNAKVYNAGTPEVINLIAKPIALIPFHTKELVFDKPVWFGQIPGDPKSFLVMEHKAGKIWLLEKRTEGDKKTLFLDLGKSISDGGARGIMGLAFHPNFRKNGRYFLAVHITEKGKHVAMTVERKAAADLKKDSGNPSRTILRWNATTSSHTGGAIEFGPDGFLYVGMGDTGPHEDPNGHAQKLMLLKGKILRIDVDGLEDGQVYSVPPDNPFVGKSKVRPEIWAIGLREPWRMSFDTLTGDLWVGDVGQDRYEEVCIVRRGENHGWNVWEGFERFSNQYRTKGAKYVKPVFAYARKKGVCIIGGHVYRKDKKSSFYGVYVFGDNRTRQIWGLTQKDRVLTKVLKLGTSPQKIVSIARSEAGDFYLVGYEGTIFRLDLQNSQFSE